MATGGVRIYPSDDMGGRRTLGAGGPSMSRQSASEMFQEQSSKASKSLTLQEAYWTDRRRQVGITRSSKAETTEVDDTYLQMRKEQVQFVKSHFHQKECRLFIPVPGQCGNGKTCKAKQLKCYCGEVLSRHYGMKGRGRDQFDNCFIVPTEYTSLLTNLESVLKDPLPEPSTKWTAENSFQTLTSNAFGKIDFNVEQIGGKKPAKYVRLCNEDSVEDCFELMKTFWHIMEPEPPHLVISVVGGAKNFKLDGRMRSVFSTGLIKAAKTTKAWLITSGFNMGVMKAVGQAVHEGQTFQWDNDRMSHVLRCIGIAPWGYVKGRDYLESSNGSGKFNAYYRTSTQILHKQPVPLNPDHTHFIFVDDGHRIRYGGVADFRSKFERKIAADVKDGGLGIPVVLLVVEGGTDCLQDVSASLKQRIPVVVCAGTGRAADILTYAYNHTTTTHDKKRTMSEAHRERLRYKIALAYMKQGPELEALTDMVVECCQKEELMTIFNMNKHEELDLAILSVLLKVETNSSRENQLKLALTWDRADIAQEEIFREDIIWSEGSLEKFLTIALEEGKVDFVRLLLNNGIVMQEYLTIERLEHLYNSIPKHSYLYQILKAYSKSDTFTINTMGNFLRQIFDRYEDDKFTKDKPENQRTRFRGRSLPHSISKNSLKRNQSDLDTDAEDEPNKFKRPYKQLLIWAVLMNRFQLAQLFWELGDEPITSALMCTSLCLGMETKVPKYLSAIRNSFHEMKIEFEKLAISVLDECHNVDPDKAVMLVERKSQTWSSLTCLQIAASASDQAFVSSVACQNSINNVWKSGIISSWPKVFLSAVCPIFILTTLDLVLMGRQSMSNVQKILTFYTAPLTKFSIYTFAYVGFLILFTYMLLVDFKQEPSGTEWLAMLWIVSFFLGGIHSFITFPSPTISGKFRDHFGVLDRLDFFNLILALVGFCVRWNHVYEGKVIYCINAVIFYIRVMKLYTANRRLGPKIYMINRMLLELAMFVMILMVFLLAYGVASQGLLYKNREDNWLILKDIIYFPYWQLYGEIFLEELETDEACTANLQSALNSTLTDASNTCRTYYWLVPILLALYLLVGNVLLLNLLIAIFSHVFDTVEKNAIEIWKYQMYFLVMEFQNRPVLTPPFCIISYIFYFMRWIYRKTRCDKRSKAEQFLKHHLEYLSLFEKEMMANKLRAVKASIMHSMEMKFHVLQTRLDELTRVIEDELIAEQYGQVPVAENVEQNADDHGKKRHKHKKKKKKKDRDQQEEKQLNINITGEEEKKANFDKAKVISDEENMSPVRNQTGPNSIPQAAAAAPQLSVSEVPERSARRKGKARRSQSADADYEGPRSPNLTFGFNFPSPATNTVLDSDEEPIPIDLYSPRGTTYFSNMSAGSLMHPRQARNMGNDELSDDSITSQLSFRGRMERRNRRHQARRRDNDDLQSRIERSSRLNLSNSYSSKML